jgi:hypothetical protein
MAVSYVSGSQPMAVRPKLRRRKQRKREINQWQKSQKHLGTSKNWLGSRRSVTHEMPFFRSAYRVEHLLQVPSPGIGRRHHPPSRAASTSPRTRPAAAAATDKTLAPPAELAAGGVEMRGEVGWKEAQHEGGGGTAAVQFRRRTGELGIGGGVAGVHSPRHGCSRRRRRTGRGECPGDWRGVFA